MHIPVLLHEVITYLKVRPNGTYADGTLGGGGHAKAIVEQLGSEGTFLGLDRDTNALERARDILKDASCTVVLEQDNFRNLAHIARTHGIEKFDGILLDLGLSSFQVDTPERGFSFDSDGPLAMTFEDTTGTEHEGLTAYDIVNDWSEKLIKDTLTVYGEEPKAHFIAQAIIESRKQKPINTTKELADIVATAVHYPTRSKRHPATRTFQALRIAVNDEWQSLTDLLNDMPNLLYPSGHIVIISFHSGEDGIVKRMFRELEKKGAGRAVTKKPITPSDQEQKKNPRSRSAKMRVFEKN
jgi:16S rRNA (cytosine1402-N4)-methyltransferase